MTVKVVTDNNTTYPSTLQPDWIEAGSSLGNLRSIYASPKDLKLELEQHLHDWGAWYSKEFGNLDQWMRERASRGVVVRSQIVVFAHDIPMGKPFCAHANASMVHSESAKDVSSHKPTKQELDDWYRQAMVEVRGLIARQKNSLSAADAKELYPVYPRVAEFLAGQYPNAIFSTSQLPKKFDKIRSGKRKLYSVNRSIGNLNESTKSFEVPINLTNIRDKRNFFAFELNGFSCYFGFIGASTPKTQSLNSISFSNGLYETLQRTLRDDYWLFVDTCNALADAVKTVLHDDLHHLAQFTPAVPEAELTKFMKFFRNGNETSNSHELWTIQQHKSRASHYKGRGYAEESVKLFQEYFTRVDAIAQCLDHRGYVSECGDVTGMLYGVGLFFLSHLIPLEASNPVIKELARRIDNTNMTVPGVNYQSHELGASKCDPLIHARKIRAIKDTLASIDANYIGIPKTIDETSLVYSSENYKRFYANVSKASPLATWDHDAFRGELGLQRNFPSTYWKNNIGASAGMLDSSLPLDHQFPVPYPELVVDEIVEFISSAPKARTRLNQNLERIEGKELLPTQQERLASRFFTVTDVVPGSDSNFERLRSAVFEASDGLLEVVHRFTQVPVNPNYRPGGWARYWDLTSSTRTDEFY